MEYMVQDRNANFQAHALGKDDRRMILRSPYAYKQTINEVSALLRVVDWVCAGMSNWCKRLDRLGSAGHLHGCIDFSLAAFPLRATFRSCSKVMMYRRSQSLPLTGA